MASILDAAKVADGDDTQELAQFEPDPDGLGTVDHAAAEGPADDPQWVVWADADGESDWAGDELTHITPGFHVR